MFRQVLTSSTQPQIWSNHGRCQDEDCKEMYGNVKRTCTECTAIVFAH